jgi:hypothetical protein
MLITEEKSYSYSCVMADFPDPQNFLKWSKNHIKEENLYMPEGGIDETPHVTVLYGLHTKGEEGPLTYVAHAAISRCSLPPSVFPPRGKPFKGLYEHPEQLILYV